MPQPRWPSVSLVREAAGRIIGKRHYATQLGAGWLLLRGTLVEMATGEGKTFAATLPAVTAALAGLPVHVITVNDYLAERDAETMHPLSDFFGLRCSAIVHDMTRGQRRDVYAGHVTYVSNKELAFDYLRDRSVLGDHASPLHLAVQSLRKERARVDADHVLRGLVFAIVDEADGVFIDEARTPLILSRTTEVAAQQKDCDHALWLARQLPPDLHYLLEAARRRIRLTDEGRDEIARLTDTAEATAEEEGTAVRKRKEDVQSALSALLLYTLDEHYVVMEDKVQIVDASTGRIMPDRAWEQGLHQMIEAKEGVPLTGRRETIVALDDEIFVTHAPHLTRALGTLATQRGVLAKTSVAFMRWLAQGDAERLNREARENSLKQDRRLSQVLAFSERGE